MAMNRMDVLLIASAGGPLRGEVDGDGANETVSGLLLDANAELYGYRQASWDGKERFKALDLGGSAAQSVVLMVIVVALTVVQFRFVEKKVNY